MKSANLPSTNWNLSSATVNFVNEASSDIYMSALLNIDKKNYNDQALIFSSIDSRRNTAFFAGSWNSLTSADGTFDSSASFVTSLDVSQIQANFDTETTAVTSALFYDD